MTWLASFYINHPIMCYIAPSLRVDGRGDIFFRSRPVGACRLGACLRLPCSAWGGVSGSTVAIASRSRLLVSNHAACVGGFVIP